MKQNAQQLFLKQKNVDELAIKHLEKVSNEALASKNGLICYTYNDAIFDDNYYNPQSMNIGDYIQSLAARQFLPNIDEFVDRDQLKEYNHDRINLIMNAWYYIWKKNEVFSKNIRPLLVAIHINNAEKISRKTLDYFKMNEPIGCRDYQTRDFLKKNGIDAYFSGCLTLTLGETYKVSDSERNNNIYFVDYKLGEEKNNLIDKELEKILKEYSDSNILFKTHMYPLNKDIKGSLYEAECLVQDYAKAKLVITQNIHCALPCLSLGTPVILVIPEFDAKRFYGIYNLFNYVGLDFDNKFKCEITRNKQGKIINKDDYLKYAEFLKNICLKFMHSDTVYGKKCEKVSFTDHQLDSKNYKINRARTFKFFEKRKNGNKRKIILFGFIKINYKKRGKKCPKASN